MGGGGQAVGVAGLSLRKNEELKSCRTESRRLVVCRRGEVEVLIELVPEFGFEIKIGEDTTRRATLESIELADWLEKHGVDDPKALIREARAALQEAAAKARVACTAKERAPPVIECRVDDDAFVFKRYGGRWILKTPTGRVKDLGNVVTIDSLAPFAERFNFDAEALLRAFDAELGKAKPQGASAWRRVKFHPLQDYVPGLGPVLGAVYIPEGQDSPSLAYLYVRDGRLLYGDITMPIRDEDAAVIYAPKPLEVEIDDLGLPYLDEIAAAWRESFTIRDLVKQVESFIAAHLTVSEADLRYMAVHVVAQYFRDVVVTFPALDIAKSGYGGGGTTALKILLALSPRPSYTMQSSPAYIYRTADAKKATFGIDENTAKINEEVRRAYAQLYIAAFDKNIAIGKADEGGKKLKTYRAASNLIVVDPQGLFGDLAFVRRAPEVVLTPDPQRRENPDLDALLMDPEVRALRARLYTACLKYADQVKAEVEGINKLPCPGTALQVFALHFAIARQAGPEYVEAVAKKMVDWYKAVEVAQTEGDPTKRILKEVYKAVVELETFIRSVSADWPTSPGWGERDVPDPWDYDWSGREGDPVRFIALFKKLRNWIADQIGTVIKVDERVVKKEAVQKRYWRAPDDAETKELLMNPYAFATLMRRHLQPFIGELPSREKFLKVDSMEALKAIKETINKALAVASDLPRCLEALGVSLSAGLLQPSADFLLASASSSAVGGRGVEGVDMGGRVGEVKADAEPTAAPLSTAAPSATPSATAGGEKPGGKEGGASAAVGEEEKAREELEKFIKEHLPAAGARRSGVIERKTKDEILREFKEILREYGELEEEPAQSAQEPKPAAEQRRRGVVDRKTKDEILKIVDNTLKKYSDVHYD